MNQDRMRTIGTCGGCGEIARRLFARVGGTPCLRYDRKTGTAVHAAVKIDGRFIHLGEDEGLVEVDPAEFEEACRFDFDPDRVGATEKEIEEIVGLLAEEITQ